MFEHGFPPYWSTLKKLIWIVGAGIAGGVREVWKTVTGTLIHITDALASPMQKCEVTLEPIQDLHGQDAPYPAGGGGNLWGGEAFLQLANDWTNAVVDYDAMTLVGTVPNLSTRENFYSNFEDGTQYTIFWGASIINTGLYVVYKDGTDSIIISGTPFVTDASKNVDYLRFYVATSDNITFYANQIGIFKGSLSASDYTPYSNICPITGWTGCEVTRTGANLCGGQKFAEAFSSCNGYSIDTTNKTFTFKRSGQIVSPIKFKDNTQYTFIFSALADVRNNNIRINYTDGTNTWVDINTTVKSTLIVVSSLGKTVSSIAVAWGVYSDTATVWYEESGIFEGVLTADDFEPYSGTTLSVTFPDTVYGGKYDFVSGGLKPYKEYDSYNGETLTGEWMSSIDKYVSGTTPTIGAQVVDLDSYDTTVQLTPQEISILAGENNVWSNSNGDTTIIYKAQAS